MHNDEIVSGGIPAILQLIDERAEEGYRIDFKSKSDPKTTDLSRDDKKALGEAVSGFANAEGGLLIIGVITENSNGVDRAKSISNIDNIHKVCDRYRSYATECVSPPVNGVIVTPVEIEPGRGIILISIPKGSSRPHMSVAPGHHRFYRRTADRFEQMVRYEIEEMFKIKDAPVLDLALEYVGGGSIGGNPLSHIAFGLKNPSTVTAKFPFISVIRNIEAPRLAEYGLDGNGGTGLKMMTNIPRGEVIFTGGADVVVHPGQSIFVSKFSYLHNRDERSRYWSASELPIGGHCDIIFSIGCESMPIKTITARFTSGNLLNFEMPEMLD